MDNLSGWAGDLQTHVRKDILQHPDIIRNFQNRDVIYRVAYSLLFGLEESSSTFAMGDLLADVDAVNVHQLMRSMSLNNAIKIYYNTGYKNRITNFVKTITQQDIPDKEVFRTLTRRYTNQFWVSPVNWELFKSTAVSPTQSDAIADAFTDRIWEMLEFERDMR